MSAIVVGSINMDLVMPLDTFPKPGETVSATELQRFPGGKGANQAVAIARLGKAVSLVGCVGEDEYGTVLLEGLRNNQVNTDGVRTIEGVSSGLAFITIDNTGQNMIVIVPGANGLVDRAVVDHAFQHTTNPISHFLTQFEIPLNTVQYSMREAKKHGWTTVLNPAPARPLHEVDAILVETDIIVLNESETQSLTGQLPDTIDAAIEAGEAIRSMGPETVVLTLGEAGSVLVTDQHHTHFPGYKVAVVDTTAAGDAFIGALVSAHMEGYSWTECIEFANAAGAYAVTQPGAQPSLPTQEQIIQLQKTAQAKSS